MYGLNTGLISFLNLPATFLLWHNLNLKPCANVSCARYVPITGRKCKSSSNFVLDWKTSVCDGMYSTSPRPKVNTTKIKMYCWQTKVITGYMHWVITALYRCIIFDLYYTPWQTWRFTFWHNFLECINYSFTVRLLTCNSHKVRQKKFF